ncbi:hypothetical protein ACTS95_08065 [Empedobacter brevis]
MQSNSINSKQIQIIQTILSKRYSDRDERLEFLEGFFCQKVESTKDLSFRQANDVIHYLQTGEEPEYRSWAFFDKNNGTHHKVLWVALEYGWGDYSTKKADINQLGKWIASGRCPVKGKSLMEMSKVELEKVIKALENMVKSKWK